MTQIDTQIRNARGAHFGALSVQVRKRGDRHGEQGLAPQPDAFRGIPCC